MNPSSYKAWGCSRGIFSPCSHGIAPSWGSAEKPMALAWPRGNAQAVLSGRLLLEQRPEGILVTNLVSETWAVCPGWRMLWPPCSHGTYEMLGGAAAGTPCLGRRWLGAVSSSSGGTFCLQDQPSHWPRPKKVGMGVPKPPSPVHSRGDPCTGIPEPWVPACWQPAVSSLSSCRQSRHPHLPASRSFPDGPASSQRRLQINSAALRREHGDLSPVPESPPPAELPRVGFDGSSPGVISNSPGACH